MGVPIIGDNLQNFVTEMGTQNDKASHSFFVRLLLTKPMLDAVYTSGGIGGKVVDCVAEDSGRKWRRVVIPDQDPKPFTDLEHALDVNTAFANATRWARLYGGSAILIEIEGDDPFTPLVPESITPDKPVTALHVRDRHDLAAEIVDQSTGIPERYADVTTGVKWDRSRVLGPFDGMPLPAQLRRQNSGWAESILARPYRSLLSESTAAHQITTMLHEVVVDVIGVQNLSMYLDGAQKQRAFEQRYALQKFMKGTNGVVLIDSDYETYETKGTAANLSGVAPVLENFAQRIAAEVDIPISRLYGKMASGLNTSADVNLEDYHAAVAGWQKFRLETHLRRLDELLCRSVYGMVPDGLTLEWVPLGEPSNKEKAETFKTWSEAMTNLWKMGAIVPAQVVEWLASDPTLDIADDYLNYVKERDGLIGGSPDMDPPDPNPPAPDTGEDDDDDTGGEDE